MKYLFALLLIIFPQVVFAEATGGYNFGAEIGQAIGIAILVIVGIFVLIKIIAKRKK